LKTLSRLAYEHGCKRFRTTNAQNIVLLDIPEPNLEALAGDLKRAAFDYEPGWANKAMLACTGIQFCKLALTETKNRAAELARQLEQQLTLDEPIRISVTGCPNSCGQHRICDVGLEGSSTTVDGVKQEAFQVFLGGGVGSTETFSRRVGSRIRADQLAQALTALFEHYQALRNEHESFQDFCRRHSDSALAGFLDPAPHSQSPDRPGAMAIT
jgi:sulfite reductase beta subunit-like hemoprotein